LGRLRQTTTATVFAQFSLRGMNDSQGLFVTASNVDHQAFANGYSYGTSPSSEWRIYAFTDRPAYRPKETMQWKFIARHFDKGVYTTPASQTLEYQINDPAWNQSN
jgi:uncharacterized protein YfaS (alpha-2-macroglobulin family)